MKLQIYFKSIIRIISVFILVFCIIGLSNSCSTNEEERLYAADASNISLKVDPDGFLKINAAKNSTTIKVTTTTRWIVEVTDCEGAWCQISYGEGNSDGIGRIGEGTFTIDAASNRSDTERTCKVTVFGVESDGSHIAGVSNLIDIIQDRQSISVGGYEGEEIAASGTMAGSEPRIIVISNQAWNVTTNVSWMSFVPGDGMNGDCFVPSGEDEADAEVSFGIHIEPNPGTIMRYAEIEISSPTSAFVPFRLNVRQEGAKETFYIFPSEVSGISYAGESINLNVYSPEKNWTVRLSKESDSSWIHLTKDNGQASSNATELQAEIIINESHFEREALLVFVCGSTDERIVSIKQNGNPNNTEVPNPVVIPSISVPWLANGWSYRNVQVLARYSSINATITGCGIYLDSTKIQGTIVENDLIITELVDLTPNTKYGVKAFITYIDDNNEPQEVVGGAISFNTPDTNGQLESTPNQDDNTPPNVN